MRILISGASGLVGTALCGALAGEGHTVHKLARAGTWAVREPGAVRWYLEGNEFDNQAAEGADAVVHLAGVSIAAGRWTEARKRELHGSRVEVARFLIENFAKLKQPPRVFLSASAIGYYGNRGDEELSEESPPGNDFLSGLAQDWEAAAAEAKRFGARVAMMRFGVILARDGGALPRMALPFRLGAGGRIGSGKQWMSWLTLEEATGITRYALANEAVRGPVNAVAPNPVTNAEFTKALARVLHRPAIFPAPGFALRLMLGEMADALLLSSQRVLPRKLQRLGYNFQAPLLEPALAAILRTSERVPSPPVHDH